MNSVRILFGILFLATLSIGGVRVAHGQLLDGLRPDHLRLDARELGWIDPRLSPAELALLDSTRGSAPPAFPESAEFIGTDPIQWSDLRGRVVVIQSWTATTSEGRALPRRVERVLQDFDPNDVVGVFVHTPEGAAEAEAFAQRLRLTQPVVVDPRGVFLDEMGIFRQPAIMIVDRSGKVRYAGVALVHLEEAMRHLVSEPFDAEAPEPRAMTPRDRRRIGVPGRDATGGQPRANFPETDGEARVSGDDLRGNPIVIPSGEGVQVIRPMSDGGPRVIMTVLFTPQKLNADQIAQFNRWSVRQAGNLQIIGVVEASARESAAWATSNNIQFALIADPDGTVGKGAKLNERDLPYTYIASPDGIVRWQGPVRRVNDSLITQIVSASGLERSSGDVRTDPRALPRWRDIVR